MVTERNFDDVDEQSDESFPASDPPSFTTMHAGSPAPIVMHEADPREPVAWRKAAVIGGAAVAAVAAMWLVSRLRRS